MNTNHSWRFLGLFLLIFVWPLASQAATYYVDATHGDDTRTLAQASNSATPWKTLAHVTASIATGDTVLLKRGETWKEEFDLPAGKQNLTVGAYDTGNLPVLYGADSITGWTRIGTSNLWQAIPPSYIHAILINNTQIANGQSFIAGLSNLTNNFDWSFDDVNWILYLYYDQNLLNLSAIENVSRNGVNANDDTQVILGELDIEECRNGIYNVSNNSQILNCKFNNLVDEGIQIYIGSNCVVSGNTLSAAGWQGMDIGSPNSTIVNNIIKPNQSGNNITIENTAAGSLVGYNYLEGYQSMALPSSNCQVLGNSLVGSDLNIAGSGNTVAGNTFTNSWLSFISGTNGLVYRNFITGASGVGIDAGASVSIIGNTITGSGNGIIIGGSGNTVAGNILSAVANNGITCNNNGAYNLVTNNLCGPCGSTGIWIAGSSHNQVVHNEIHDSPYGFSFDSGWDTPDEYNIIAYNKIYNCYDNGGTEAMECAGSSLNANQLCYNLIYNNTSQPGIYFEQATVGSRVENNVFYNNDNGLEIHGTGVTVRNNIFVNSLSNAIWTTAALDGDTKNCFFQAAPWLNAVHAENSGLRSGNYTYTQVQDFEPSCVSADPQFVNAATYDFHLKYSSPCIDQGVLTGYTRDFDNQIVPLGAGQEIGALEYILAPHLTGLGWTDIPSLAYQQGTVNNAVFKINCSSVQYDNLQSLTMVNLGTAVSASDIPALWLKYSASGNSGDAVAVAQLGAIGVKTWAITGLNHQTANNSSYFLMADISASAVLGRTCQFSLPSGQMVFQFAHAFPPTAFNNTDYQVINAIVRLNPEVAVDLSSAGRIRAAKGETNVPLAQISLTNFTDYPVRLNWLLLHVQAPDGSSLACGAVFSAFRLLRGSTTVASFPEPLNHNLDCGFSPSLDLASQETINLLVQGDISRNPTDKFCLVMADNQCLNAGQTLSQAATGKSFPMSTTFISLRDAQLAATFSSYPNPFQPNQGAKIGYYLANEAQVKLTIWTLDHHLVKTLTDARQPAGMQEISWDGRNGQGNLVRNGVYLLVIDCTYVAGGHETYTRKIAVSK